MTETLKKGTRVTGADRTKLAADLKKRYNAGESIRSLAGSTGRSYGFVHRILTETGVVAARPRRRHPGQGQALNRGVPSPTPEVAAAGPPPGPPRWCGASR